jgi:hypothetical protein
MGKLAEEKRVVIATKLPPGWLSKAKHFGEALDQSLVRLRRSTIDFYQHHCRPGAFRSPLSSGSGKVAIFLVRTIGRVGPVSGGTQLGVWSPESDWRPTRLTFGKAHPKRGNVGIRRRFHGAVGHPKQRRDRQ